MVLFFTRESERFCQYFQSTDSSFSARCPLSKTMHTINLIFYVELIVVKEPKTFNAPLLTPLSIRIDVKVGPMKLVTHFYRYDASEVEGPAPQLSNNAAIDEVDYSVEKWKEVIWDEVKLWETVDTSVPNPLDGGPGRDANENKLTATRDQPAEEGLYAGKPDAKRP